jgi:hypothetical protein
LTPNHRPWRPRPPPSGAPAPALAAPPASQAAPARTARPALARVSKKIPPGQPGAKRWQDLHGDRLLCVRYRDDLATGQRLVTVELVVDQRPLPTGSRAGPTAAPAADAMALVRVHIRYGEPQLAAQAKAFGARRDPAQRFWIMTRDQARSAGLTDRIQPDDVQY